MRSLHLLNRRGEALALFETAAKKFTTRRCASRRARPRAFPPPQLATRCRVAFERAASLAPARLDVAPRTAETWLASAKRRRPRRFRRSAADASKLKPADVIQFLLKQDLAAEAQAALAARLAREPHNFDLRMVQLTVAARLADHAGGATILEETRPLADTDARHRRWLEGAVAFHEVFETDGEFLAAEQRQIAGDPASWTRERLERTLAFADVAAAHGGKRGRPLLRTVAHSPRRSACALMRRQFILSENDPRRPGGGRSCRRHRRDPAHADGTHRLAVHFPGAESDQAMKILAAGAGRCARRLI